MTQGKIVLVSFPFDDFSSSKVRPALCLTNPIGVHRHIILAFITSRVPDEILESDLVVEMDHPQYQRIGLRVRSTIRLHRLLTISTDLIRRELGELPLHFMKTIELKMNHLFSLK